MDQPSRAIAAESAVAAVLEPPRRRFFSRRRKAQPPPLPYCENCVANMSGPYCAQCGQHAVDYRRSFGRVLVDALDSFLNWDSRFFATIGWLLVRPWKLTIDFLAGKRVRYVHPLRLYLLVSIVFFFVVNFGAKRIHTGPHKLTEKDRAELAADLNKENLPPEARDALQSLVNEPSPPPAPNVSASPLEPSPPAAPSVSPERPKKRTYGKVGDRPFVLFDEDGTKPSTPFEKWLESHAKEKLGEHGTKAALFIATLFSNLPYMMLCCIPLFALVLKLLYVRRRIFYIDHLIYALHIHAFFYLGTMLTVFATIGLHYIGHGALVGWMIAILWIAFAVQIFLSVRRVYRQSWLMSLFKFTLGGVVYFVVLLVAFAATFFVTLALPG